MLSISGFDIKKKISRTANNVLYEGVRLSDGVTVIVKVSSSEYPTPHEMARLQHEYDTIVDLDLKGVIKPLSLEQYDKGVALILEYVHGAAPLSELYEGMELRDFLSSAISIALRISALHQKNIIHKDINPNNIFVNLDSGTACLTGLELASNLPRESPNITSPRIIEGTLPYISPEQTGRMNRAVDYRSDFYSLGVTF